MLIVSCRRNFRDDYECANNQIANIDLKHPAAGSISTEMDSELENWLQGSGRKKGKRRKVLLLIHGYNNTFVEAMHAYRVIRDNQRKWIGFHDTIIGFTWPGGNSKWDYENARNSVTRKNSCVVDGFTDLLNKLDNSSAVKSVDVLSHSLGCRISLAAYSRLKRKELNKPHRQFLTAADVNMKSIVKGGKYFSGSDITKSCHVFYSNEDGVLSWLRGLVASKGKALGLGNIKKRTKNISPKIHGVNCLNVLPKHPDNRGHIHSRYKYTKEVYKYIKRIVNGKNVKRWTHFQQKKFSDRGP